ncbi:unnamed protein product [Dovyalis caffra]|uniref:Uncharacterized protein n=1 Tax=Dovyalis caffra TaxID=77055 RepID=A0AAV1R1C3_9ROSI|nr:unnamed protein product [Dovyalis caffra]
MQDNHGKGNVRGGGFGEGNVEGIEDGENKERIEEDSKKTKYSMDIDYLIAGKSKMMRKEKQTVDEDDDDEFVVNVESKEIEYKLDDNLSYYSTNEEANVEPVRRVK